MSGTNTTIDWHDLEDEEFFREKLPQPDKDVDPAVAALTGGTGISEAPVARYEEPCPRCRGSGIFRSWSGRVAGQCYHCKGKGKRYFRTSPEARAKQRQRARRRKVEAVAQNASAWAEAYPAEAAFLKGRADSWDFAASLLVAVEQYGGLTIKQLASLRKCMRKDEERATARAAREAYEERAKAREAQAERGLDLSAIPPGCYAVPNGDTRLKLRISHGRGRWEGTIFVDDGAEYGSRRTYGRQSPGGTYRGQCVDQLAAIAADPLAAAAAYGHLTGACGVCGRALEDAESVARGIGPVCLKKF